MFPWRKPVGLAEAACVCHSLEMVQIRALCHAVGLLKVLNPYSLKKRRIKALVSSVLLNMALLEYNTMELQTSALPVLSLLSSALVPRVELHTVAS